MGASVRRAPASDIIIWADIPVTDMERATEFHGHVTGKHVAMMENANDTVAVSADLYLGGTPSHDGARIFLASGGDIGGMQPVK